MVRYNNAQSLFKRISLVFGTHLARCPSERCQPQQHRDYRLWVRCILLSLKSFVFAPFNVVLNTFCLEISMHRSARHSSAAAPGSCISISAQAELLYDITSISEAQAAAQWSASTVACPIAAASPENSSRVPYSLIFKGLDASNSSSRQLAIKIQATQKASGSLNTELRWSRTISFDFSAGSALENLDLDLQLAKLYSIAKLPPSKPFEDLSLVSKPSKFTTENNNCVPSLEKEKEDFSSKKTTSPASQVLVALFCLTAGILTGKAFSAKLSPPNIPKQTCEVACSPFIVDKFKASGKAKKHKWIRDDDGRLQREDKIKRGVEAAGDALDSGILIEDVEDSIIDIEE
jgi:hypothetical protein